MTYVDKDDRDLDLNELSDFYDDSTYDELYGPQTFGERLDKTFEDDYVVIDKEDMIIEKKTSSNGPTQVEEGFGEAINPNANPHLNDQLEDDNLNHEAEADYKT